MITDLVQEQSHFLRETQFCFPSGFDERNRHCGHGRHGLRLRWRFISVFALRGHDRWNLREGNFESWIRSSYDEKIPSSVVVMVAVDVHVVVDDGQGTIRERSILPIAMPVAFVVHVVVTAIHRYTFVCVTSRSTTFALADMTHHNPISYAQTPIHAPIGQVPGRSGEAGR